MTELGDRFREFAALCDKHEDMVAAGMIARPNETIVTSFVSTKGMDATNVATALYYACMEPPDPTMFREVDEVV
jgi:hypothetical protein